MTETGARGFQLEDKSTVSQYLRKQLKISTVDGYDYEGLLYTCDPVSNTMVLAAFGSTADHCTFHCILKDAVRTIIVYDSMPDPEYVELVDRLVRGGSLKPNYLTPVELQERKAAILHWMGEHRLPVNEMVDGKLSVINGLVMVEPPYDEKSCIGGNTVVLDRIRNLIKTVPALTSNEL